MPRAAAAPARRWAADARLHTRARGKLYKCGVCFETFRRDGDDTGTHRRQMPHECDAYSGRGLQNDDLLIPLETEKRYKCTECQRRFYTASYLESHLFMHIRQRLTSDESGVCHERFGAVHVTGGEGTPRSTGRRLSGHRPKLRARKPVSYEPVGEGKSEEWRDEETNGERIVIITSDEDSPHGDNFQKAKRRTRKPVTYASVEEDKSKCGGKDEEHSEERRDKGRSGGPCIIISSDEDSSHDNRKTRLRARKPVSYKSVEEDKSESGMEDQESTEERQDEVRIGEPDISISSDEDSSHVDGDQKAKLRSSKKGKRSRPPTERPPETSSDDDDDYERLRQMNIRARMELIKSLGIAGLKLKLSGPSEKNFV